MSWVPLAPGQKNADEITLGPPATVIVPGPLATVLGDATAAVIMIDRRSRMIGIRAAKAGEDGFAVQHRAGTARIVLHCTQAYRYALLCTGFRRMLVPATLERKTVVCLLDDAIELPGRRNKPRPPVPSRPAPVVETEYR